MNRTMVLTGLVMGALAIGLGAFGAHGLGKIVDASAVETFEVGVRYQMYHALFLLFLGVLPSLGPARGRQIFWLVVLGVLLFSGSIYLLSLNGLTSLDFGRIGFLTPIGGMLLIAAWVYTGLGLWTGKALN